MNIQSLSVCVPSARCINNCKFCCSKMHPAEYENRFLNPAQYSVFTRDMRIRLEYARENGCNTCILTGNNEPQQNREFLRVFSELNSTLRLPFRNIEMQTTGTFIDDAFLGFLQHSVGLTTMAISVACLDDDKENRDIIQTSDEFLMLDNLCAAVKKRNMNLRLCLNMSDRMLQHHAFDPKSIVEVCGDLKADQITFRKLWAPNDTSEQQKWVKDNVTSKTADFMMRLKNDIKTNGRYLDTLEYGSDRYDYYGFSVVIDEDCMAKGENRSAVKYLILRPNGHLYSKWDSKASLIF